MIRISRRILSYLDGYHTFSRLLALSAALALLAAAVIKKHFGFGTDTIETIGIVAFVVFFCLLGAGYLALAKLLKKWMRRD
jgi:hypothetical protein